jgi:flagellar biosynthesis/type III secretory pathway M-ring protein FliF/YscJ
VTPLLTAETTEAVIAGVPATVIVPGLVTLILGIITSIVAIVNRKGGARDLARQQAAEKKAKDEQDERARREPGWDDIVAESRKLREDLGKSYDDFQRLRQEFKGMQIVVDRRDRATARVLRSAADQWPKGTSGPVFDPADLAILEDTMPHQWRAAPNPEGTPA